jgi:hypothetical protein
MKFRLVNPLLKGDIETHFSGDSSLDAANKAYQNISQYFNNNVPRFYFTLEGGNKDLHHFYVNETRNGDNADYTIKEYEVKPKYEKELRKQIEKFEQEHKGGHVDSLEGGKHRDSSSSSSSESWLDESSSTGKVRYNVDPIVYWWYYPAVYRLTKFYVPTFVQSVTPYIYIYLNADAYWINT